MADGIKDCVLIISHSNYLIKSGGVEKFIRDYCGILERNGIHYIHVFPVIEINKKMRPIRKEYVGISLNGGFVGIWDERKLAGAVKEILRRNSYRLANCQIHHFHGWNARILSRELKELNVPCYFMVHDLESISPHMKYGGSEEKCMTEVSTVGEKENCVNCVNEHHQAEYAFKELRGLLKGVYSPSENTKGYFVRAFPDLNNITCVRGHLMYEMAHEGRTVNRPVRVAYLGSTAEHKGYREWEKLIAAAPVGAYSFYYFGAESVKDSRIRSIRVDARDPGLKGMAEQLQSNNIDIAFLWSKWPETYCYTYYEAFEAGCFVVTCKASGNICEQVIYNHNGVVFDSFSDCLGFMKDIDEVGKRLEQFAYSNQTPHNVRPNEELIGDMADYGKMYEDGVQMTCAHKMHKCEILTSIYEKMRM